MPGSGATARARLAGASEAAARVEGRLRAADDPTPVVFGGRAAGAAAEAIDGSTVLPDSSVPPLTGRWDCSELDRPRPVIMIRPMTEADNDRREPAPDDADPALPFDAFEIETEALPDGRQIHYYRWPAEPQSTDV